MLCLAFTFLTGLTSHASSLLTPLMHRTLPSFLHAHAEQEKLSQYTYEAAELQETKKATQIRYLRKPATKLAYSNKKKFQTCYHQLFFSLGSSAERPSQRLKTPSENRHIGKKSYLFIHSFVVFLCLLQELFQAP